MATTAATQMSSMEQRVQHILKLEGLNPTAADGPGSAIRDAVQAALSRINQVTPGGWGLGDVATAKTYDAPPSSLLNVSNILPSTPPVIVAYGVTLSAGDYNLLPDRYVPGTYSRIERVITGVTSLWTTGHDGVTARGQITISAVWSAMPDVALRAWEGLSVRYYRRATQGQYSSELANDTLGAVSLPLSDDDILRPLYALRRGGGRQIQLMGTG